MKDNKTIIVLNLEEGSMSFNKNEVRKISGNAFLWNRDILLGLLIGSFYIFPSEASAQQAAAPVPASAAVADGTLTSYERAVALDQTYGLKGWNIAWPSFGETVTQDDGNWRTNLAQYGFSLLMYDIVQSAVNVLDTPSSNKGAQAYWGQKPSVVHTDVAYLQYDLSQWGVPNGQLQVAGLGAQSTWQQYAPNTVSLYRLAYYQTFLDKALEVNAGYMSASTSFVGNFVAGQIQNPFGPSASIPVEVGFSQSVVVQPMAWAKYHLGNFYEMFGAARSVAPVAGAVYEDNLQNPAQARFTEPGPNVLYANEVGYKTAPSNEHMSTWVRAGGIYNTSEYHNYETNRESTNYGLYLLVDRQLTQINAGGRGIYAGFSAMYAPPDTNIYSKYYEGRLYAVGPFNARPRDTISFVWAHNGISRSYADAINMKSAITDTFASYSANSYTASYNMRVTNGVYLTLGLQYTDHPSVAYIPAEGHSLNFLASTFIAF
jgi:porin